MDGIKHTARTINNTIFHYFYDFMIFNSVLAIMILALTTPTDIGILEANTMAFPLASYKTWQIVDAFGGPISFVIRLGREVPTY